MTITKAPNYTNVQAKELVEAYEAETTEEGRESVVADFAAKFGKSTRSIRQKLVREEVYVKKEYKTKTGSKTERKEDIVDSIAKVLEISPDLLSGLEKATKGCLNILRTHFVLAREMLAAKDESE